MKYKIDAATDQGSYRKTNQDSILTCKKEVHGETFALGVLCDGMGGLEQGDVASQMAVELFREWFEQFTFEEKSVPVNVLVLKEWKTLISNINRQIYSYSSSLPVKAKMGTTLSAILLVGGCYVIGHVGDSRVYVVNHNSIQQLTEDHSLLAKEIREGKVSSAEGRNERKRHLLLRSVGVKDEVIPQFLSGEFDINDSFLICSDGLWNRVEDSELQKKALLQEDGANQLIELARSRNEKDNISVIKITGINEESISERNNQKVFLAGTLSIMVITLFILLIMVIN